MARERSFFLVCRCEKLEKWTVALEAYETFQLKDPNSVEWLKGRMRCLYALGHWDRVSLIAAAACDTFPPLKDGRDCIEISSIAAAAELNLRNYSRMAFYVHQLKVRFLLTFYTVWVEEGRGINSDAVVPGTLLRWVPNGT